MVGAGRVSTTSAGASVGDADLDLFTAHLPAEHNHATSDLAGVPDRVAEQLGDNHLRVVEYLAGDTPGSQGGRDPVTRHGDRFGSVR